MKNLDATDRALLERMQASFPLVSRPFKALGQALDLDESEVLARVRRLKNEDVIRQIGAIFDTRRLGYHSTLVAFHVPDEAMETVAAVISAHPGVSHNYARPHHYGLWFTLAVPADGDLAAEIGRLARQTGVDDWLDLPATRVLKIRTHFKLEEGESPASAGSRAERPRSVCAFAPTDIPLVRALQQDLNVVPRPFAQPAGHLGVSEEDLMDKAQELAQSGIMRRYCAVLRHRRVGYTANGMACWVVPEDQIERVGQYAAAFSQISHCYQRPAYPPRWPYTLFTMIHAQTQDEVEAIAAEIARKTGIEAYQVLYSSREFKKERIRYFEERL